MRNKLRAIWHVLLGDSVMYRVTASRHDKIAFRENGTLGPWWRLILPPSNDVAVIECDTWEERDAAWQRIVDGEACPHHYYGPGDGSCPYAHAEGAPHG